MPSVAAAIGLLRDRLLGRLREVEGVEVLDGQFRVRIEDRSNSPLDEPDRDNPTEETLRILPIAGVDDSSVTMFFLDDTSVPLLVDRGDGVCQINEVSECR